MVTSNMPFCASNMLHSCENTLMSQPFSLTLQSHLINNFVSLFYFISAWRLLCVGEGTWQDKTFQSEDFTNRSILYWNPQL